MHKLLPKSNFNHSQKLIPIAKKAIYKLGKTLLRNMSVAIWQNCNVESPQKVTLLLEQSHPMIELTKKDLKKFIGENSYL